MITPTSVSGPGAAESSYAEIVEFFDTFAAEEPRWRRRNRGYHRMIEQLFGFSIPKGSSILELGSGSGDLLASLEPSHGVGIDLSPAMTELAHSRHPALEFATGNAETYDAGQTFDYVILSDLTGYADDLYALFENVRRHSHERTRVIVQSYSQVWRPILRLAELLRLRPRKPVRNWISPDDARNMLDLAGFEILTSSRRVLFPKRVPLLSTFLNGVVGWVWPLNALCLTWWLTARPEAAAAHDRSVTVVCPCRNEAGNVAQLFERVPALGSHTELVFVEGGSKDDTRAEIVRQIAAHPEVDAKLVDQPGTGKGDAVRAGFAAASGDALVILDGDLSVDPEALTKFYRALAEGRGELINGSRLVYDVDPQAMRFLNLLGNKLFSRLFQAITGQRAKDTLCGTKMLHRRDYDLIARERSYFGDFDPFGDFDLLFGASRLGLKIVDLPVRYRSRTYGQTNISRFRHGLLLVRMTLFAFWKFQVAVFRARP
jgi:ubiquinone/menaquinone biosynthesis C-methylase UbiE